MDTLIPAEMTGAKELALRDRARRASRYRVQASGRDHPVMEITPDGFVIEADGRPPLRGYADIFQDDERVLRGLVVCSWARDGLVGYEFKRDTSGADIAPDYVPPAHAGLLEAPKG